MKWLHDYKSDVLHPNKTDCHDITDILLKVELNTMFTYLLYLLITCYVNHVYIQLIREAVHDHDGPETVQTTEIITEY